MEYTIIANKKSYKLPQKTIAVMEKLDEVVKVDSIKEMNLRSKFETLHEAIKDFLGEETAEEILGSSDLEKVDLSEITLTIRKIVDAYDKPIQDYQDEKMRKSLSGVQLEKILSLSKAAQSITNMQMIKK